MLEKTAPYFIGVIILSIIGEAWYSAAKKKGLYETRDTWTSIAFGILGVIARLGFKGLNLLLWYFLYKLTPLRIESSIWSIVILFILNELVYYWFHRISHEVKFFSATHVNHHSSMKLNFSVAVRTPFLNAIYHILFWIPLPLLGFHPLDILVVETISFFFAFVQHTTIIPKLGMLEWILNTPSHHRVHHASNTRYIDKNYGNVLIIYDRIFGTFVEEKEKPIYGITNNPKDRRFLNMVFHVWKEILRI